jgi:hypothetical protein
MLDEPHLDPAETPGSSPDASSIGFSRHAMGQRHASANLTQSNNAILKKTDDASLHWLCGTGA